MNALFSLLPIVVAFWAGAAIGGTRTASAPDAGGPEVWLRLVQTRQTCRDMRTCRDAVILWCEGYRRADADDDGIPCENVCDTLEEVDAIRNEIGC